MLPKTSNNQIDSLQQVNLPKRSIRKIAFLGGAAWTEKDQPYIDAFDTAKILAENGILGLLTLGGFFLFLLKQSHSYLNSNNKMFKNIIFAFLGTLFMNMTMNAFTIEAFWIITALLVGVSNAEKNGSVLNLACGEERLL